MTYDWLIDWLGVWFRESHPWEQSPWVLPWYGRSCLSPQALADISGGPTFRLWHLGAHLGFPGCLIHSARNNLGVQQGMAGCLLRSHGFIYLVYKLGKNTDLECKQDRCWGEDCKPKTIRRNLHTLYLCISLGVSRVGSWSPPDSWHEMRSSSTNDPWFHLHSATKGAVSEWPGVAFRPKLCQLAHGWMNLLKWSAGK